MPYARNIQFADLILGLTCNVIHNDASNSAKIKLTEKIYPLISRILSKKTCSNKNSSYNIKSPYYYVYFEKVNMENDEESAKNEENEELNEIEKLNMKLNRQNNIKTNINELGWHCLDFSEEKPNNIFNEFFNDEEI